MEDELYRGAGTSPESLLLLLYGRSWKEELRGQYK
jgi:hypothetical protein